jgi:uncharacterized membrane protein
MPTATETVTVARDIDTVFAFLADGRNNPRWRSGVVSIDVAVDEPGVGRRYRQRLKGPAGRPVDGDYEVTEQDAPTTLAFVVVAGPARPHGRFDLAPAGADTTTLTFTLELAPTGVARLMAPVIASQMKREVAAIHRLKEVLEADKAP